MKLYILIFIFSAGMTSHVRGMTLRQERKMIRLAEKISMRLAHPRVNQINLMLAEYFFEKEKYNKAIEFYSKVKSKEEVVSQIEMILKDIRRDQERLMDGATKEQIAIKEWEAAKIAMIKEQMEHMPEPLTYSQYKIGESHFCMKDYDKAKAKFSGLIKKYPDKEISQNARIGLMMCHGKEGKTYLVEQELKNLKKKAGKKGLHTQIQLQLLKALYLLELYETIVAEDEQHTFHFLEISTHVPVSEEELALAKKKEEEKKKKEALPGKEERKKEFNQAMVYYTGGQLLKCVEIVDRLKRYPEYVKKARKFVERMRSEVKLIAEGKFRNREELYYAKGCISYFDGKIDEAVQYWKKVLKENPGNKEVKEFMDKLGKK